MKFDINKLHKRIDEWSMNMGGVDEHIHIPCQDDKPRYHLGLSSLGDECLRKVWYGYRKVQKPTFPPALMRLFRRGDREEFVFTHMLRAVGIDVHDIDENGEQYKVKMLDGNAGGSLDGVGIDTHGFYMPQPFAFLLEYKTYNKSRFNVLVKKGVKVSDPKYYFQMQGYGNLEGLKGALFCAVCKDDDRLHFEWVDIRKPELLVLKRKGKIILESKAPPRRIANNESFFMCKNFCSYKEICHRNKAANNKNCRSCKHSRPTENAVWECTKGKEFGTVCKKWKDITKSK